MEFFLSFQICPICAALPGGDPNHVTDDFAAHLTLEHRAPRDLISFEMQQGEKLFAAFVIVITFKGSIHKEKTNLRIFLVDLTFS